MAWVDANVSTLNRVNRNIWGWAETGLEEVKSSNELQELLRANGFTVEAGVAGMPTAFVATYGTGQPVIGILAEFDALPGPFAGCDRRAQVAAGSDGRTWLRSFGVRHRQHRARRSRSSRRWLPERSRAR